MTNIETYKKPLPLCLIIGVLQGIIFNLFHYYAMHTPHIAEYAQKIIFQAALFCLYSGITILIAYNGKNTLRLVIGALTLALLLSLLPTMRLFYNASFDFTADASATVMMVLATYTAICLLQSYHLAGYQRPDYTRLFTNVWNNASLIISSGIFVNLVYLIVLLWGGLFFVIGIHLFSA